MARSPKSSILIAHCICWGAAILCALILTYGPHGPARPPRMMLISLMPLIVVSIVALNSKGAGRSVIVAHGILWAIACITSVLLVNDSLGEGLHPIATTVVMMVLGVISLAILSRATLTEPSTENET